jgi:hypothetical protein
MNRGSVTSPALQLSGNADLRFWCNRNTENADGKDRRFVKFVNEDADGTFHEVQSTELLLSDCGAAPGVWHEHSVPIAGWWGTAQVRFFFNTVDAGNNSAAGWFIDDLSVVALPSSGKGGGGGGGCGLTGWEGLAVLALLAALRRRSTR